MMTIGVEHHPLHADDVIQNSIWVHSVEGNLNLLIYQLIIGFGIGPNRQFAIKKFLKCKISSIGGILSNSRKSQTLAAKGRCGGGFKLFMCLITNQ